MPKFLSSPEHKAQVSARLLLSLLCEQTHPVFPENFAFLNLFDPTNLEWTELSNGVKGVIPVERTDSMPVQVDETTFLFGGRDLLGKKCFDVFHFCTLISNMPLVDFFITLQGTS